MPITRLKQYLKDNQVTYTIQKHETTFTAQESAARSHVPPRVFAKTVIVKLDGALAMAVLPANAHVSLGALRDQTGAQDVQLATEWEFKDAFPDCEMGAMPPFGNLYNMRVYADETLAEHKDIVFNACSHEELIRMPYSDWIRLVRPKVMELTSHREHAIPRTPVALW
jgi:Ala-tRNA(Pro) deacylase